MKMRQAQLFITFFLLFTTLSCQSTAIPESSNKQVRLSRGNWDTGHFQDAIYQLLLTELGYEVIQAGDLSPELFYPALADGAHTDLWANGWQPDHNAFLAREDVIGRVTPIGYQVKGGAIQGYLIDKATADQYGITSIMDMKKPEIAALFDTQGDSKADLTGCNIGWACGKRIEMHLNEFGLKESINHLRDDHSLLMTEVVSRHQQGQPVFFYTWTPNWTGNQLVPGEDVVWITVPEQTDAPAIEGVIGCTEDPCSMGFVANDLRAMANTKWLEANPTAAALLELIEIPVADISAQNERMFEGENSEEDVMRHAEAWVEAHRQQVDEWLEAARTAQ